MANCVAGSEEIEIEAQVFAGEFPFPDAQVANYGGLSSHPRIFLSVPLRAAAISQRSLTDSMHFTLAKSSSPLCG
jgi:hypothetical protein